MPEERPVLDAVLDIVVFAPIGLVLEVVQDLPKLSERGRGFLEKDMTVARMIGRLAVGQARRRFGETFGGGDGASGRPAGWRPGATGATASGAGSAGPAGPSGAAKSAGAAGDGLTPPPGSPAPRRSRRAGSATGGPASGAAGSSPPAARRSRAATPGRAGRAGSGASRSTRPTAPPRPTPPARAPGQADASPVAPSAPSTPPATPSAPSTPPPAETEQSAPNVGSLAIPGYDTLAASQVVQRLGSLGPDELDAIRRYEVATRGRRTVLHRIAQLSGSDGRASA